ncbi:hypothetical protein J3459_016647 [Metarhizium acridum]|nr:hypothetical protein J3459_016647 [Metarhizium acridum]
MIETSLIVWDRFDEWLKSDATTYWISGKPGSFFWRPGTAMQKSIRGLPSSLLYQLIDADASLLEVLFTSIEKVSSKDTSLDWSLDDLKPAFRVVITETAGPVCVSIDEDDEMESRDNTVKNLIHLVSEWTNCRPKMFKMCFSSRPEAPIQRRLINFPHLRLEDLTAEDMRK